MLTDEQRQKHVPEEARGEQSWCQECREDWPCDASVLSAALSAAEDRAEKLRAALEDMVNQFAYWSESDPPGQVTGGLSALEEAFAVLGYDEPHPAEHLRCDEPDCRQQSSAGTPTLTGYRRTCHEHLPKAAGAEFRAAWHAYQSEHPGTTYSEWVRSLRESSDG